MQLETTTKENRTDRYYKNRMGEIYHPPPKIGVKNLTYQGQLTGKGFWVRHLLLR